VGPGTTANSLLRTTHADYFHGPVPVTDVMPDHEIETEYELNTGHAYSSGVSKNRLCRDSGSLVANHAHLLGTDAGTAAHNAVILESVARHGYFTRESTTSEPVGRDCTTSTT